MGGLLHLVQQEGHGRAASLRPSPLLAVQYKIQTNKIYIAPGILKRIRAQTHGVPNVTAHLSTASVGPTNQRHITRRGTIIAFALQRVNLFEFFTVNASGSVFVEVSESGFEFLLLLFQTLLVRSDNFTKFREFQPSVVVCCHSHKTRHKRKVQHFSHIHVIPQKVATRYTMLVVH